MRTHGSYLGRLVNLRSTRREFPRLVFEAGRQSTDFDRRGRITLLLDPEALTAGIPCRVRLLLVKPGDPRDGEELYRRSFLLTSGDASQQ